MAKKENSQDNFPGIEEIKTVNIEKNLPDFKIDISNPIVKTVKSKTKSNNPIISQPKHSSESHKINQNPKKTDSKKSKPSKLNSKINNIFTFLKTKLILDHYNLAFLIILTLTVLFHLKYFSIESIWNDSAVHLWFAIEAVTEPIASFFSINYYLGDYAIPQTLTAFYYLFTNKIFLAGKLMALTYAVLASILIYIIGTKLRNKFTGLIAAILFGFNHAFLHYSIRPLGDAPLAVSVIFFFYCLIRTESMPKDHSSSFEFKDLLKIQNYNIKSITEKVKGLSINKITQSKLFWGILTGISLLATMLHKVQASILVLSIPIYMIIFKRKEMFKDKGIFATWFIPVFGVIAVHIVAVTFFGKNLLGRLFGLMAQFRGMPFGLEALGRIQGMFSWYLIPFIFVGLLFVILYKQKKFYPLITMSIFYWLYFEINVDHTQERYMLPILAVGILLAAFAIEELSTIISNFSHKKLKMPVAILITICIVFQFLAIAVPLIDYNSYGYLGLEEAGDFLQENMGENDILFAGSPRMMRPFTNMEFYSNGAVDSPLRGGDLYWLRGERYHENFRNFDHCDEVVNPNAQENFETDIANFTTEHTIWLEIDIWEYTQPRWYYDHCGGSRLQQDSLDYFTSLGFELVHYVIRDVGPGEANRNVPVIFVFKKEQSE
ncbi:hypothetical protein HOA92_05105 [archaeon]|jgi:hypothetical protein|nr:hypothetical protein [archaeon]MBT6762396.1 hypothetical protein [archaeon]